MLDQIQNLRHQSYQPPPRRSSRSRFEELVLDGNDRWVNDCNRSKKGLLPKAARSTVKTAGLAWLQASRAAAAVDAFAQGTIYIGWKVVNDLTPSLTLPAHFRLLKQQPRPRLLSWLHPKLKPPAAATSAAVTRRLLVFCTASTTFCGGSSKASSKPLACRHTLERKGVEMELVKVQIHIHQNMHQYN